MKVRMVTVRISRQAGIVIEKPVPAWEVRVLNEIFGAPEVEQVGSVETELRNDLGEPINFNAREQYETLVRKYGTATDGDGGRLLDKAYRDPHDLQSAFERMQRVWEMEAPIPPKAKAPAHTEDFVIP